MSEGRVRIPSATYRLQFHAGFTFRNALAILDYLADLGVSDIYASPYFQSTPESTHGYDISNHSRLNPAIGDNSDFRAFVSGLKQRSMGQILDFVPNHMGIGQSLNAWWMSVLEEGRSSRYANYFDIDWHPGKEELTNRVLLPILGDRYGKVLENGELKLGFEEGRFFLRYFETTLPINPRSYPLILRRILTGLDEPLKEIMGAIIKSFERAEGDHAKANVRELLASHPALREQIVRVLRDLEGKVGTPVSFDDLHEVLEAQVYRLSYWRVAAEEINYRRFFDINTLAAIRVEIPEVFEATHKLVFELLAQGDVTGLRIDHIDGLWDPRAYLRRLQERTVELTGEELYLIVEKILDPLHEHLPADWPVHGTTGYDFANQAALLFVDSSSAKKMTKTYERFSGMTETFDDLVYKKKNLTMQISLGSEVSALGRMLDELSEMSRNFRDFTRHTLTVAVREVMACFPVYRTYVAEDGVPSAEDEKVVLRAILTARRRNPSIEKAVFDFLRGILLMRLPDRISPEQREAHVRFVMKFQQCSGPVMAKGLEDTALYIYNRLVALNEVGGHPGVLGVEPLEFHRLNSERHASLPNSLLATSTHDTKRSEDVRMRLAALSEIPQEWQAAVNKWSRLNKKHRTKVEDEWAPSRNEEYLLYQTLIGSWPLGPVDLRSYAERIQQYMTKALKEAKINSSWTGPNEEWEQAVSLFVERILGSKCSPDFLGSLMRLVDRIAPHGAINSLAQTVLKCTTPGVPDIYQGTELWDFSLVDPDNRRPVDYQERRKFLASLPTYGPGDLVKDWKTGRIKLHITRQLMQLRRVHSEFFRHADYQPLETEGAFAKNAVAFSRAWKNRALLVVIPRLTAHLGEFPMGKAWEDTSVIEFEGSRSWKNIMTGKSLNAEGLAFSDLLSDFPVGVFFNP